MSAADRERALLRHYLAALAYRTEKALRGAPEGFGEFAPAPGVRTPLEIVRHMTDVLGFALARFTGGEYRSDALPTLDDEVARLHQAIGDLARHLVSGTFTGQPVFERLLQGPLADAMTHAGQLAMLRRLAGDPVPPENFFAADIRADRFGPDRS